MSRKPQTDGSCGPTAHIGPVYCSRRPMPRGRCSDGSSRCRRGRQREAHQGSGVGVVREVGRQEVADVEVAGRERSLGSGDQRRLLGGSLQVAWHVCVAPEAIHDSKHSRTSLQHRSATVPYVIAAPFRGFAGADERDDVSLSKGLQRGGPLAAACGIASSCGVHSIRNTRSDRKQTQ